MSKRFASSRGEVSHGTAGSKFAAHGGKIRMTAGRTSYPGQGAGVRRGRGVMSGGNRRQVYRPQGIGPRTGGFTGIERKFYDTSLVGGALTAPSDSTGGEHDQSATICMNSITQGDGESQRDGRVASIQGAYVKGTLKSVAQHATAVADDATKIYVALVLDTQTNGAQLNSEDVFKNQAANANLAASPMRNMQFTQRFRVLDTFECVMGDSNMANDTGATGGLQQSGQIVPFTLSSNLQFRSQFSGTTESVANITDNSLHVIAYCSNTELVPTLNYNARIRFVG